jgi:hypothetical protein
VKEWVCFHPTVAPAGLPLGFCVSMDRVRGYCGDGGVGKRARRKAGEMKKPGLRSRNGYLPIRLQQCSHVRRFPLIGQAILLIPVSIRRQVAVESIIEDLQKVRDVPLMDVRELDPRCGVVSGWGKGLPITLGGWICRSHIGDGEVVPEVVGGELAIAALISHDLFVSIPAAEEDATSAC